MPPVSLIAFCALLLCVPAARAQTPGSSPRERQLLASSLAFCDARWDPEDALIAAPSREHPQSHRVRESSWYALGLLLREQPGDRARAIRILRTLLSFQFNDPAKAWYGTFKRAPEEPEPTRAAKAWDEYDPNWREFIGTTFALILLQDGDKLPPDLSQGMRQAIQRAVEGEIAQKRLVPNYTNIALMHGFLWSYAAHELGRTDWVDEAARWTAAVYELYAPHQTFEEYNSPTYYGVDLFGLALWRRYGATPEMRARGAEMEAGLWRDIGRFYNADLMNMSGPFDRAYGMDMRKYVSLVGAWIGLVVDAAHTPLPDPAGPMDHDLDFMCIPTYVAIGPVVPPEVVASLQAFQGARQFERVIDPKRVAAVWMTDRLMIGGERTALSRPAGGHYYQFHPATIYWRAPNHELDWILVASAPAIDARVRPDALELSTAPGSTVFTLAVGPAPKITKTHWSLPGLEVEVRTNATSFAQTREGDLVSLTYRDATQINLQTRGP